MVFPVVMYGCESWNIKKAEHRRTDAFELVLEKTPESPLDCKEIQPVHPKGNQSWIFIGRTDAETEAPIIWLPDAKSWFIWKDPDARKDWRWEERGTNLLPGRKELDTTEWLNWTERIKESGLLVMELQYLLDPQQYHTHLD